MNSIIHLLTQSRGFLIDGLRISIFIVMIWIGSLKAFTYEADGIVPYVANSPLMRFFYRHPSEYGMYKNKEGELVPKNIEWHRRNGTYVFAYCLGSCIILIGLATLLGIWFPYVGMCGGLLTFGMSLVTLSFLITTPETYVPNLGGPNHGFPFLSASGRLVIKDVIMLFAGLVVAADCAATINSALGHKVLHINPN